MTKTKTQTRCLITQHMLYFWNPNMMIDTSPWSSSSRHQLQNLKQTSSSRLNLKFKILAKPSFKISTKIQLHSHQRQNTYQFQLQNLAWCLNFNFKILTEPCAQSLKKSLALWTNLSSKLATNCCPHDHHLQNQLDERHFFGATCRKIRAVCKRLEVKTKGFRIWGKVVRRQERVGGNKGGGLEVHKGLRGTTTVNWVFNNIGQNSSKSRVENFFPILENEPCPWYQGWLKKYMKSEKKRSLCFCI